MLDEADKKTNDNTISHQDAINRSQINEHNKLNPIGNKI